MEPRLWISAPHVVLCCERIWTDSLLFKSVRLGSKLATVILTLVDLDPVTKGSDPQPCRQEKLAGPGDCDSCLLYPFRTRKKDKNVHLQKHTYVFRYHKAVGRKSLLGKFLSIWRRGVGPGFSPPPRPGRRTCRTRRCGGRAGPWIYPPTPPTLSGLPPQAPPAAPPWYNDNYSY